MGIGIEKGILRKVEKVSVDFRIKASAGKAVMPGLSFDASMGPKGTEVIKAALGGVETRAVVLILCPRLTAE